MKHLLSFTILCAVVCSLAQPAHAQSPNPQSGNKQSTGMQPAKIPYGNNPAAGKYYSIRGFSMYCEVYGEGQPRPPQLRS